jgi:site-specific recombinase XerD
MSTDITTTNESELRNLIVPADANKDTRSRLEKFVKWTISTGGKHFEPDLPGYRDFLLKEGGKQGAPLNAATTRANLATVRSQYARLLRDNQLRSELMTRASLHLIALGQDDTPANRAAFVNEAIERLRNCIDAKNSVTKVTKKQDRTDESQIRLTRTQAEQLLNAPGVVPLESLRDTALIALMLCTGVREFEAINVEVADLRQRLNGELSLCVIQGKGDKDRLIPYGDLSWVLAVLDKWLAAAGITEGKVFRSFFRGGRVIRGELSLRAVENIVGKYPVMIDGKPRHVKPHDLRRTYARLQYEAGKDLLSISQNLGHSSTKTTELYIGTLNADKRRSAAIISYDLTRLEETE